MDLVGTAISTLGHGRGRIEAAIHAAVIFLVAGGMLAEVGFQVGRPRKEVCLNNMKGPGLCLPELSDINSLSQFDDEDIGNRVVATQEHTHDEALLMPGKASTFGVSEGMPEDAHGGGHKMWLVWKALWTCWALRSLWFTVFHPPLPIALPGSLATEASDNNRLHIASGAAGPEAIAGPATQPLTFRPQMTASPCTRKTRKNSLGLQRGAVHFAESSEICFFQNDPTVTEYHRAIETKVFDGPSGHKARHVRIQSKNYSCDEDESDDDDIQDHCDGIAELMTQQRHLLLWSSSWA